MAEKKAGPSEQPPSSVPAPDATSTNHLTVVDGQTWMNSITTGFVNHWQSWSSVKHLVQLIALLIVANILWTMFGGRVNSVWRQMHSVDGFIIVDSPEVYTRERLINERLGEDTWLRQQLEEADKDNSLIGVRRTIKRRLQLGTENEKAGVADDTTEKAAAVAASITTATDSKAATNEDVLTFDQRVRIKSANRDFIQQRMIENRLDDRHDLIGNSLYVLKFDTTVVSNDFDNRKAVVEVYVMPPIKETVAPNKATTRGSPIDFALGQDPQTLNFIRRSFVQFIKESEERINFGLAELPPETPNLDTAIKRSVSQQFGYQPGASAVIVKQQSLANIWTQYTLSIASIANFVDFIHLERPGARAVPVFRAQEKALNFRLFNEACVSPHRTDALQQQFPIVSTLDLPRASDTVAAYLGSERIPRVRLMLDLSGYLYKDPANGGALLQLIARSIAFGAKVGDSRVVPWGGISLEDFAVQNADVLLSAEEVRCKVVTGFINIGFLNFAENVAQSNTYSYSVLPRQSAVSVVDEVVENASSRLSLKPAGNLLGELGLGSIGSETTDATVGTSLNSRVTAFGDARQQDSDSGVQIAVGWIIDPKAGRVTPARNDLTTTAESVMAIVSVPSWWPHLNLKIKKSWLTVDGKRQQTTKNDEIFSETADSESAERFVVVNLPNSQQLLDSSLIGAGKRGPKLDSAVCENIDNRKSEKESDTTSQKLETVCVIRGKKLWRNTVVTFGPVEHASLKIMPDMEGLIASFPLASLDCKRGLAVWTSEGRADLRSADCKIENAAMLYTSQ